MSTEEARRCYPRVCAATPPRNKWEYKRSISLLRTGRASIAAEMSLRTRSKLLYKYYPPERVDVLENKTIYFTHPSKYNDPFEGSPYVEMAFDPEQVSEELPEEYRPLKKRRQLAKDYLTKKFALAYIGRDILVFSVSELADNPIMWAHYAASHEGFAVAFDATHTSFCRRADGGPRHLQRVNYSYLRPKFSTAEELEANFQKLFLVKSNHWQHEREWRMFESPHSDNAVAVKKWLWGFQYDPAAVRRIFLGTRMSSETAHRIADVLAQPDFRHVTTAWMARHQKEYRLREVPYTLPWLR